MIDLWADKQKKKKNRGGGRISPLSIPTRGVAPAWTTLNVKTDMITFNHYDTA